MGYWNALWDHERQTWHDQMADTVVVRVGTGAAPAAGEAAGRARPWDAEDTG